MSYVRYVIGVDPSGAFHEGKGTTGLAVYDIKNDRIVQVATVAATDYDCLEGYLLGNLHAILDLYKYYHDVMYGNTVVSIEDFLVYATHAASFTNSKMETCQLIGLLRCELYTRKIKFYMRPASAVKSRWTDEILAYNGYIKKNGAHCYWEDRAKPLATHERDAIKHAVHCGKFEVNKHV